MKTTKLTTKAKTEFKEATLKAVYRNYWNGELTFRPYRDQIHNLNDRPVVQMTDLGDLFQAAGIEDGDEIEITVRATGNKPWPCTVWKLIAPHTYDAVKMTPRQIADLPIRKST